MGTCVSSVGEASQAKNSRLKPRIEESRGRKVDDFEEDTAKNTPDSDKVKGDARQSRGELDSLVEGLVPRALHADLGLGSGNDVAPALNPEREEDAALGLLGLTSNVEMPPSPDEDEAEELDRDAVPSSGVDTGLSEVQALESSEYEGDKLGGSDQDSIVLKLRAEIAALRGQGPSPSTMKGESESPTVPEFGQKGVVRKVLPFQVCQLDDEGPVKTRTVAKEAPILKATVVTTRNMAKVDKVRTRGDGPAKEVEIKKKSTKKAQKRQKVDLPVSSQDEEDEEDVSINGDQQLPPAKVKRTGRR